MPKRTHAAALVLTAALAAVVAPSLQSEPRRVCSRNWWRWVHNDRGGVSAVGSERPIWPSWTGAQRFATREEIAQAVKAEGADPRGWSPRNSNARYWVVDQFGEEHDLDLSTWAALDLGSKIPD